MDLRSYYKKVRETEAGLQGDHFVLVSLDTPEGGKAGVCTEAARHTAARLISESRARLATQEEAQQFHDNHREAKAAYEQEQAARRVQVMVIPSQELKKSRESKERS